MLRLAKLRPAPSVSRSRAYSSVGPKPDQEAATTISITIGIIFGLAFATAVRK